LGARSNDFLIGVDGARLARKHPRKNYSLVAYGSRQQPFARVREGANAEWGAVANLVDADQKSL
jgi:hypothetical protein